MNKERISFNIPQDFEETWKAFQNMKPKGSLSEQIRNAIKQFMHNKGANMMYISNRDGKLINLAQARYILESRNPNRPYCYAVFGDLTSEQNLVLLRLLYIPIKGLITYNLDGNQFTKDIDTINDPDLINIISHNPHLGSSGKVEILEMPLGAIQGLIESKVGDRVLNCHEATAIGLDTIKNN